MDSIKFKWNPHTYERHCHTLTDVFYNGQLDITLHLLRNRLHIHDVAAVHLQLVPNSEKRKWKLFAARPSARYLTLSAFWAQSCSISQHSNAPNNKKVSSAWTCCNLKEWKGNGWGQRRGNSVLVLLSHIWPIMLRPPPYIPQKFAVGAWSPAKHCLYYILAPDTAVNYLKCTKKYITHVLFKVVLLKIPRTHSFKWFLETKTTSGTIFFSETRGRITGTERCISANNKHASL